MGWIFLLLLFFIYCSGSLAQFTLTQPPLQSASLGDTARISCTIDGTTFGGFDWYQQKDGQSPSFILSYKVSSGETKFGTEVSGNFSASTDNPRKVAYLTVTSVLRKDEATYYCGAGQSSGSSYVWVFGGGTTLTISGQPTVAPKVHLFPPSKEELESKSKATLVCLLQEFSPAAFQVTWVADGTDISNGVETTKATKVNDKYVASSYLTVSASDWKSHESFSCKVTHEGSHFMKSVSHSQCP